MSGGVAGLDAELLEKVAGVGVAVRLVDRFGLEVSGEDAGRYLNGQVTNDVRRATRERAVYSCVTDAKGRLEGEAWIRRGEGDAFLLDAPLVLEDSLPDRLERYAIADDVTFRRVKGPAWHVFGGGRRSGAMRFGIPGTDSENKPAGLDEIPAGCAEQIRVLMGLPGWGTELVQGMLPAEAGIESIAISYDKGCYVGQEVISRMRRAGKTNRSLLYLVADRAVDGLSGEDLVGGELCSEEGAGVGEVTSAAYDPRLDRWVALAYVKRAGLVDERPAFFLGKCPQGCGLSFFSNPPPYRHPAPHA